ncbi:MAG: hypothetical protein DRJ64_05705, partial [Thermoprotei archaeon]
NGRSSFVIDYNSVTNRTTLVATEPNYALAWNPDPKWIEGYYAEPKAPADGNLSWSPGDFASSHNVYLGTDYGDVNNATDPCTYPGCGNVSVCSYNPGGLEFGQTYYWRIDEVNDTNGTIWKGKIWSFTVFNGKLLDDFESYADTEDLLTNWSGYPANPTLEKVEAIDYQSMQFDYNNPGDSNYSVAALDLGSPQDWTTADTKVLSIDFFGTETNGAEQMYLAIADDNNNISMVAYSGDANDLKKDRWQNFDVAVADFADGTIDLSSIKRVGVWLTGMGAAGTIYIDNVEVVPSGCFPGHQPAGDINGDCTVDITDANTMVSDWLDTDFTITAQSPDANFLVAWYKFDSGSGSTAVDSSSNGNNGSIIGAEWVNGKSGDPNDYALKFRGLEFNADYVECGTFSPTSLGTPNEMTVTYWVKWSGWNDRYQSFVAKRFEWNQSDWVWHVGMGPAADTVFFWTGDGTDVILGTPPEDYDWVHVAITLDGSILRMYYDGHLVATGPYALGSGAADTPVRLGSTNDFDGLNGVMDDVRFYSYALSQEEVISTMGLTELYFPIASPANITDPEQPNSRAVNLADFAVMAADWLEESVWP